MSTADRHAGFESAASAVAAACRDAEFVRLVASADGDALAAIGVLARALDATGRPFQASVVEPPADPTRATDADVTIAVGCTDAPADHSLTPGTEPLSETAFEAARELGVDGDPVLALAGASTADGAPSGDLLDAATEAGVQRRPGVAVPTTGLDEGLAYSTLVHAPFSGNPDAASEALAALDLSPDDSEHDDEARRRIASMLAIRTVAHDGATPRAADAVEGALRPHAGTGPFATVEGFGDVLDAVAREQPGTGVALALGYDASDPALDAWRTHGERAHRALRTADTGRYDGLFVARVDRTTTEAVDGSAVPVGTVARLLREFRSPEPVVLVVTDGRAAAVAADDADLATRMQQAAQAVDGRAAGTGRRARATFEGDASAYVTAFREAR